MALAAAAYGSTGCGGGDRADHQNTDRPATPINVSAAVSDAKVSVTPRTFGAGPIVIVVSNQSGSSQTLTLQTDELGGAQGGIRRSTSAIAPRGTARLQADVRTGRYRIAVEDRGISAASVEVGRGRKSAQDELLQP